MAVKARAQELGDWAAATQEARRSGRSDPPYPRDTSHEIGAMQKQIERRALAIAQFARLDESELNDLGTRILEALITAYLEPQPHLFAPHPIA
jgi:hypothetical protein